MKRNFANEIRTAIKALGKDRRKITISEIAAKLDLVSGKDKLPLYSTLRDLRRSGEIERVVSGTYRWTGKKNGKPQVQEVMWRILRMRKVVTKEDLQELAGASRNYAKEWLNMLVRREVARKLSGGRYQLISDAVEMPVNIEKAEKLYMLYMKRKREAIKAVAEVSLAMRKADSALEKAEHLVSFVAAIEKDTEFFDLLQDVKACHETDKT